MTEGIDWATISGWSAAIGTGIGAMVAATYLAIRKAIKVAASAPQMQTTITREDTKIVTTDSVAMHSLTVSLEATNATLTELMAFLRIEADERRKHRQTMEQREEMAKIARRAAEDVQREAEEEEEAEAAKRRSRRPQN